MPSSSLEQALKDLTAKVDILMKGKANSPTVQIASANLNPICAEKKVAQRQFEVTPSQALQRPNSQHHPSQLILEVRPSFPEDLWEQGELKICNLVNMKLTEYAVPRQIQISGLTFTDNSNIVLYAKDSVSGTDLLPHAQIIAESLLQGCLYTAHLDTLWYQVMVNSVPTCDKHHNVMSPEKVVQELQDQNHWFQKCELACNA
jgi:hypothetical protein